MRLKCYSLRDLAAPWISTTSAISITGTASPLEADRDIFESMGNNSSLTVHFEINNVLKGTLVTPSWDPIPTGQWRQITGMMLARRPGSEELSEARGSD